MGGVGASPAMNLVHVYIYLRSKSAVERPARVRKSELQHEKRSARRHITFLRAAALWPMSETTGSLAQM